MRPDNLLPPSSPIAEDVSVEPPTPRPWIIHIGKYLRGTMDRLTTAASTIPIEPVLDPSHFPWTATLAQRWPDIAAEVAAIIQHREAIPPLRDLSPDHADLGRDGKWRSFFLVGYGYEVTENCARAPITAALVQHIPDLNSAFFSILEPGAVIPRHRGVSRGIVTCHLGVMVPTPPDRCWMQVDQQKVHWRHGEWIIFDDSFEHQVANDTDQTRIILLIQVKRPMHWIGRLLHNAWLWAIRQSPFVQEARRNFGKWERAYQLAEMNAPAGR